MIPGVNRLVLIVLLVPVVSAQALLPAFEVQEATIAQIHAAMRAKTLTCHALVTQYLRRIAAYDKNGPAINAIVLPARLIGDLNTPHGDNSQFFSPTTGFPAIQVPMGCRRPPESTPPLR